MKIQSLMLAIALLLVGCGTDEPVLLQSSEDGSERAEPAPEENSCAQAAQHVQTCEPSAETQVLAPEECIGDARGVAEETLAMDCAQVQGLITSGREDAGVDSCSATRRWLGLCKTDESLLGPEPAGVSAEHLVVLVHGYNTNSTDMFIDSGVAEALGGSCSQCIADGAYCCEGGGDGHDVFVPTLPPYHSSEVRGELLTEQLDAALAHFGKEKAHLIGHSLGGLDSRYVVSSLGYGDKVATVTTIGTPHHGSAGATATYDAVPEWLDRYIEQVLEVFGPGSRDNFDGDWSDVRAAIYALTKYAAEDFNRANPNDPSVDYFTWAGISTVGGFTHLEEEEIEACEGNILRHPGTADRLGLELLPFAPFMRGVADDGMVEVTHAIRFPTMDSTDVEFLGCVAADHMDLAALRGPYPKNNTGFDPVRFYRNQAYFLSARETAAAGF